MFAGAQIVTSKLVHRNQRKEIIDGQNEDKTTQDLINMAILVPRSKAAIVVETRAEKVERKVLAQERRQERLIEQQKLAQHMENLMEKALRETPLSRKDEDNLRDKIKNIVAKVNKDSNKADAASVRLSPIKPPSSSSRTEADSIEESTQPKPPNQGAFLLWYDRSLH